MKLSHGSALACIRFGMMMAASFTWACRAEASRPTSTPRKSPHGLYTRLRSHGAGRRSGDQFCVYVADRLVLPNLTPRDIEDVVAGRHQMDAHIRAYVHKHLGYRFAVLPDGIGALALEASIKNGALPHGKPMLNPG